MANLELLIETTRSVTLVVPQTDREEDNEDSVSLVTLKAYAPMYKTLIDPPYELPAPEPIVKALQSELFTLLIETLTPLAVVNPDVLKPKLQAYAPTYRENDPP